MPPSRSSGDTTIADPGAMAASLYVVGTQAGLSADHPLQDGAFHNRVASTAHAVARPVVDGLAASVCGVLVTAMPELEWRDAWAVPRCAECERVTT